jgi:hypothetical protein
VPALALLLWRLIPFPDEQGNEVIVPDGPPAEPTPRAPAPRTQVTVGARLAAPAAAGAMTAFVPLLVLGVLSFVVLSTFSRRHG